MKEQKKYHQRKLAIIEMIEECDTNIKRERAFLKRLPYNTFMNAIRISKINIERSERIKERLNKWLGE